MEIEKWFPLFSTMLFYFQESGYIVITDIKGQPCFLPHASQGDPSGPRCLSVLRIFYIIVPTKGWESI